jgi:hypothetical protein
MIAELKRLEEADKREVHWRRWGPYLADRQWGTVREDYSSHGTAWDYFPHDHARSRVYRWGEDGLLGVSDNHQRICLSFALWNEQDSILKERLFGLAGPEGNHGEDVKELYYYLDSTPTHSWMQALYKYPQRAFPYADMVEGGRRPRHEPERELIDTGIFDDQRYFDVFVEYARDTVDDLMMRLRIINRGPQTARLHVLPTIWFRNTWSWGANRLRPRLSAHGRNGIQLHHPELGNFYLNGDGNAELLFTENETNSERHFGLRSRDGFYKDAFHRLVVDGQSSAVNPQEEGTKAARWHVLSLAAGEEVTLRLRFSRDEQQQIDPTAFDALMTLRQQEADQFYDEIVRQGVCLSEDACRVERQALAGLLWTKQYYHYVVEEWLDGDSTQPAPPEGRRQGRNRSWRHLHCADILSMPDKWEYPWFAAWDSAFHMIPFAMIDPGFARQQLGLFLREWYMHPNGQIPAYEWAFNDVNPPVHAWACWRVYQMELRRRGRRNTAFLESVFHKLLMNFTWWVNRKDSLENNVFEGGFLGLDNIGVFDRSQPLPTGGTLEQSDATSWMAMYCTNMLRIALELAQTNRAYEDIASKFFEHFLYIAAAMNRAGDDGLWDEEDGFYYDKIRFGSHSAPMKIHSMVGLIPLFASKTIEPEMLAQLPGFTRRMRWFIENRPDLAGNLASMTRSGVGERKLLSLVGRDRLRRILERMLSEEEFLSPYGIRSLSRFHAEQPFVLHANGRQYRVDYEPAESLTGLFGGNSNWRGPIWFPVNFLIIEALQRFHHYHGDSFTVEFPTGSGRQMNLQQVAQELSRRLSRLFLQNTDGQRPSMNHHPLFQQDEHFRNNLLFYEYFHGDTGLGLGASHQTGWTALVAKLLQQSGEA